MEANLKNANKLKLAIALLVILCFWGLISIPFFKGTEYPDVFFTFAVLYLQHSFVSYAVDGPIFVGPASLTDDSDWTKVGRVLVVVFVAAISIFGLADEWFYATQQ